MLFTVFRLFLFVVASVIIARIIKHSRIVKKRLAFLVSVVLCIVVISTLSMFPIENLFVNFKSPENVFKYVKGGEISEIIYGERSCLILYTEGSRTGGYYICPKTEDGYAIPTYYSVNEVSHKFDENGLIDVYFVEGTEDYYVFCSVLLKDQDNKIDVFNAADEKIDTSIVRVEGTGFIYFYLHGPSNECYLTINGNKVLIF